MEEERVSNWLGFLLIGIIIAGTSGYIGYSIGNKTNSPEQIAKNMEYIMFTDYPYKNFVDSASFGEVKDTYSMYIQRGGTESGRQMLASLGNRLCYGSKIKGWYLDSIEVDNEYNATYEKFIKCMKEAE